MLDRIEIIGARTHNLKNVSCSFEHGKLTVITGVSGSGKSSLAFDTLYAEGQRRYVESLSTYARQFLDRMERPDIDGISGVQPAIALEQKNGVRSARSTVGTATEIQDFLRLLFARLGETTCPDCRRPVRPETPESAMAALSELPEKTRLVILAPTEFTGASMNESLRAELIRSGYHRLWEERADGGPGAIMDLEAGESPSDPGAPLSILVDRLAFNAASRSRLQSALQTAFTAGRGQALVLAPDAGESFRFSAGMRCDGCGRAFPTPEPQMFSFYSPIGACPACEGFGRIMEIDFEKVIPNRDLSLDEGAIAPWNSAGNLEMYDLLREKSTGKQIPRLKPLREFTPEQMNYLIEGVGGFPGVRGYFNWLESKKYKVQARVMLARYRAYRMCPSCGGTRLRPEALNVRFSGRTVSELGETPVRDLLAFFDGLSLGPREIEISESVMDALLGRLRFLNQVGLGYLTLNRATRTLSGGESQRINLATALGAGLTQTLYVLDEPTVGLHARDTDRLIAALKALRDLGNTVVVVEHDLEVIRAADHVMDMGPGAGELGGRVLFAGAPRQLERAGALPASSSAPLASGSIAAAAPPTPTARHIASYHEIPIASREREPNGFVRIEGARGNNLKNITVEFPLGVLCVVSGVSGSGKTTLVRDTLTAAYRRRRELAAVEMCPFDAIKGLDLVQELCWVDQSPLARSSRSNPATYVKAFDVIRQVLGATREARAAGVDARYFSFNVDLGRCPTCEGAGTQVIDMHFMADVEVVCETCDGKRFRPQALAIRHRGKNIHDILNMTVDEAAEFFAPEPRAARALGPLREVGLGYLRLGQNTTTLSGGEAQRLKLAGRLAKMREGAGIMLIFDEPTTGLHASDVARLTSVFQRLVDKGCSLIVVEHNLDLIAAADHVIDMGPDGGDLGGRVVAQGPPEAIMKSAESLTGAYLRERFQKNPPPRPEPGRRKSKRTGN